MSLPITLLDIILIGVMLISALFAMIRGFMREVLSISAWLIAAIAALLGYSRLSPVAKNFFGNWPDWLVTIVVAAGIFIFTLLIVTILTVRLSDFVLDSRVGALDRTLGFLFGLGRGLLIIAVAYIFFAWFAPPRSQPAWILGAKSRPVLEMTGEWIQSLLPDDIEKYLQALSKRRSKPDENEPSSDEPRPGQRSSLDAPAAGEIAVRSDWTAMHELGGRQTSLR